MFLRVFKIVTNVCVSNESEYAIFENLAKIDKITSAKKDKK